MKKKHMMIIMPLTSLFFTFSFLLFHLYSHRFSFHSSLQSSTSLIYSSAPQSLLDNITTAPLQPLPLTPQQRILFPDHVLLTLPNSHHTLPPPNQLQCIFYKTLINGSHQADPVYDIQVQPVLSTDRFHEFGSFVRCSLPSTSFSAVDLHRRGEPVRRSSRFSIILNWDKLAYEATLDGDTVVVFVKGLNLRPHTVSDPTRLRCHLGFRQNGAFWFTTKAVSAAQEIVRCSLPQSIKDNPGRFQGLRLTLSHVISHVRHPVRELMASVARVHSYNHNPLFQERVKKYKLCVCSMMWNQGRALREWVMYHAWLGVERWFIYDNNSDDEIEKVVKELDLEGYNVSRLIWPWIKTQEAGFSHCALRAREECNWVGFFDVDEFFYFPNKFRHGLGKNLLRSMVVRYSNSKSVAEIRTACYSFGPSGLNSPPKQGVTVGYTCRLQSPERHKSIVRPDLLDDSLLNVVHHFQLRNGFRFRNMPERSVVINHYKYQVWETFKTKFYRRVATYVADWQEEQNQGSKDRAPGLGTEAVEPPNWRLRFCEVWDTGLKDFILSSFADSATGLMPWERSYL